jgi:hypothetical protein
MRKLSPLEIQVKKLVDVLFADEITYAAFSRELSKEKVRLRRKKQRRLPMAQGRTSSEEPS